MPEPNAPADSADRSRDLLVATLRRTGIVPEAALADALARPDCQGDDARALGRYLFQSGLLTRYQLNNAALGRDDDLLVGPYDLLDRIAEGGAGQVFRARHRVMNRVIALKRIRPEMLDRPDLVARFFQEAQVAAQLDHPNVVRAYDAGQAGASCFLAMEYVDGIDLTRLVQEGGPLPIATACDFARQAADALHHAHERGLVHRDVKPSNFLVAPVTRAQPDAPPRPGPGAQVKLLDLGLARWHTGDAVGKGPAMGSPHFVAPEQARNADAADTRSDLYALGGTLYYLLTGQTPFNGTSAELVQAHLSKPAPRIETLRPGVPAALGDLIARLLEKDPAARPQTPGEVVDALGRLINGLSGERPTVPAPVTPVPVMTTIEDDEEEVDEDPGQFEAFHSPTAPARPSKMARAPANSRRTLYIAFGIGLHVAALLLVVLFLYLRSGNSGASESPKPVVRTPIPKPKEKPPVVEPPKVVEAPPVVPPPVKPAPKAKTPAAVKFARGSAPEGKEALDVSPSPRPARPALVYPKGTLNARKLPIEIVGEAHGIAAMIEGGGLVVCDGRTRIIDPATGKERGLLADGRVDALEMNPNGVHAAGLVGGALRMWTVDPPGPPLSFPGDPGKQTCLAHVPNGHAVLAGGEDGKARLWDLVKREAERTLDVGEPISAVAVAPNGWLAIVGTANGQVGYWDLESQTKLGSETRHMGPVRGLALSHDGNEVISTGEDGKLFVWSLTNGRPKTFLEYPGKVGAVFTAGPGWGVTGLEGGKLLRFNLPERQTVAMGDDAIGPFQCATLAPDGKSMFAVFGSSVFQIALTESADAAKPPVPVVVARKSLADAKKLWELPAAKPNSLRAGRFATDGRSVAVGTIDGSLVVYSADKGTVTRTVADAFDPSGVVAAIANRFVTGVGFLTPNEKAVTKHGSIGTITAVGVSGPTTNDAVVIGNDSGALYRLKPGAPTYNRFWPAFDRPVRAATISRDGKTALAVSTDQLSLVSLADATPKVVTLGKVAGKARLLQFVEAGRAVFADDKTLADIAIAPVGNAASLKPYTLPPGTLRAATASADGAYLIAAVGDELILYRAGEAEPVDRLALPRGTTVQAMDVAPDGKSLLVVTDAGVIVWEIEPALVRTP
ncbi:MAG: protein kinase [Gemmataceae bacterium]|nr:protein kinase [Gemmataceae bacterium]